MLAHSGVYDLEREVAHLEGDEDEISHGGKGHRDDGQRNDSSRRAATADVVSSGIRSLSDPTVAIVATTAPPARRPAGTRSRKPNTESPKSHDRPADRSAE
jgi:hypothetical protein